MKVRVDFLKQSRILMTLSLILCMIGGIFISHSGFNYGVDFAGGIEMQIRFNEPINIERIREVAGKKSLVQSFGNDKEFLLRVEAMEGKTEKETNQMQDAYIKTLSSEFQNKFQKEGLKILRVDSVGSQIGSELKKNGLLAIFYCLLLILIYVGLRFDYIYSPPAVICLFHDTLITLGIFSVLQREVNVQTLAAILTIIGYSLNDTIVTFDRVRENIDLYKKESFYKVVNISLGDVLSRTLLTSVTTLIAVGAMYFFARGVIRDFAFTLGLGVVVGTYSSIYIAAPLLLLLEKLSRQRAG